MVCRDYNGRPWANGRSILLPVRPFLFVQINMAGPKRGCSSDSSTDAGKKTKRQVTMRTFKKWQHELGCEHHMLPWLPCKKDKSNRSLVAMLRCDICRKNEDRIWEMRSFSGIWVSDCTNHKMSKIVDHATSDQHAASMAHQRVIQRGDSGKFYSKLCPDCTVVSSDG